ncbi:inositol 1,3,4-trisphosphate 5/6-kinase family protein [Artemisia annua]|uniref:Inositol 1,3,4-trisphosphate 5/6-kinase family protein n=1 Tax=Artemisia annua TaxID=35608 RepID=A0A2U1MBH5_ARTAN|nr:inositol 1,3,4-trisphosphate 5/6-kinase family protein [Artemisia annua]
MKGVVVGYALTSKKIKSFLQPKLEGLARNKGIYFVAIDQTRPLTDQGPFDIVLHKLSGKEWQQILEDYRLTHPEVTVLDPPGAIQHVYNRQSMLQDVADLDFSDAYGTVGVPRQLVIEKDPSSISDAVRKAGLSLPLGIWRRAVGWLKSHELITTLMMNNPLQQARLQLVLQESGFVQSVAVGDALRLCGVSLYADVSQAVSSAGQSADDADLDPCIAGDFHLFNLGYDFASIGTSRSLLCASDNIFSWVW